MADNQTNKWSEGVRFVQFMKNRAYHSAIKRSPYEAMFGCPAKVGLSSSIIPQGILHSLKNEEDLEKLDQQKTVIMEPRSKTLPSVQPLVEDTVIENVQLPSTSKELPMQVEEVINEVPLTITPPNPAPSGPVKMTVQDTACIVCTKETSGAHSYVIHVECLYT